MRWKGKCYRTVEDVNWTRARKIIFDIFRKTKKHLSADEVFMKVRKNYPSIGIATVYRTLDFLCRNGILNRLQFRGNKASYEICPEKVEGLNHHHHLICNRCGRIIDYSDFAKEETELISEMERALSKKYKFKIETHHLHFYGICSECQKKEEMILKGGD